LNIALAEIPNRLSAFAFRSFRRRAAKHDALHSKSGTQRCLSVLVATCEEVKPELNALVKGWHFDMAGKDDELLAVKSSLSHEINFAAWQVYCNTVHERVKIWLNET
jgi:hypothetical protein